MADFETGVSRYVKASVTVVVYFPVDGKGNEEINCYQCPLFHRTSSRCGVNDQLCAFPQKYVGQNCPLQREE